jgi:hypothetical protein
VRLEVAVHEAGLVSGGQAATGADQRGEHLGARRSRVAREPAVETRALDELHRDEVAVPVAADLVDDQHVRVLEPRHRTRLAEQALAQRDACREGRTTRRRVVRPTWTGIIVRRSSLRSSGLLVAQHLHRDRAVEIRVVRLPHDAHAALAEHALERVPAEPRARLQRLSVGAAHVPMVRLQWCAAPSRGRMTT